MNALMKVDIDNRKQKNLNVQLVVWNFSIYTLFGYFINHFSILSLTHTHTYSLTHTCTQMLVSLQTKKICNFDFCLFVSVLSGWGWELPNIFLSDKHTHIHSSLSHIFFVFASVKTRILTADFQGGKQTGQPGLDDYANAYSIWLCIFFNQAKSVLLFCFFHFLLSVFTFWCNLFLPFALLK